MKIARTLRPTTPSQPPMRVTRVTLEDGRWINFYGQWLSDEEAMNRTTDELEAPEI